MVYGVPEVGVTMTSFEDDISRLAHDTEVVAQKAASDLADAAASIADQARDSARQAFDKIKAARLRAEQLSND